MVEYLFLIGNSMNITNHVKFRERSNKYLLSENASLELYQFCICTIQIVPSIISFTFTKFLSFPQTNLRDMKKSIHYSFLTHTTFFLISVVLHHNYADWQWISSQFFISNSHWLLTANPSTFNKTQMKLGWKMYSFIW